MALTPGFKKFVGLIVVVGAVGGGLYYYKTMPKSKQAELVQTLSPSKEPAQQAEIPQPYSSPIFKAQQAEKIVEQVAPPQPEPAPQVQADPGANRGMAALMNAGKR